MVHRARLDATSAFARTGGFSHDVEAEVSQNPLLALSVAAAADTATDCESSILSKTIYILLHTVLLIQCMLNIILDTVQVIYSP